MILPRWVFSVVSIELRKIFSYRFDFWGLFLGSVGVELGVAYFLWKAIYDFKGVETLGGYDFHSMMFYFLLVPLTFRAIRGPDIGGISTEIYDGSLNRYIIYPVSFVLYKLMSYFAHVLVSIFQLLVALGFFILLFGTPENLSFSFSSLVSGIAATLLASLIYFFLALSVELVAFWADNVWSLGVILRFGSKFLGGGMIPLTLFPDWFRSILEYTPFPYFTFFPIQCFMGETSLLVSALPLSMIITWTMMFGMISLLIWKRGSYQYSGVGI